RIKNTKTGLYYQPVKNGNNLSKKGKVYQTKTNILKMGWSDYIGVSISRRSRVYSIVFDHYLKNGRIDWDGKIIKDVPEYGNIRTYIPKTDFIIEKIGKRVKNEKKKVLQKNT